MRLVIYSLIACLLIAVRADAKVLRGGQASSLQSSEEFVGPFASWACARSSASGTCGVAAAAFYNAVGDGSADDTTPLQNCLNGITTTHPICWVPAGTYKITHTLNWGGVSGTPSGCLYCGFIFADPATTSIVWAGGSHPASGTHGTQGAGAAFSDTTAAAFNAAQIGNAMNITAGTGCSTGTYFIAAVADSGHVTLDRGTGCSGAATWAMTTAGTMLYVNGITFSRVERGTFNAAGTADAVIVDGWTGNGNYFPTGNEYADLVIENAVVAGFDCGLLNNGCSEVALIRDQFINDNIGVNMLNFNALNVWAWYSTFVNNAAYGLTNVNSAGDFAVFSSYFNNPGAIDIGWNNVGSWTFRNNFSTGSSQFIFANNGASETATIQGNTVLDTTSDPSIGMNATEGLMTLLDNTIRSRASGATSPVACVGHNAGCNQFALANALSVGNTVTMPVPGAIVATGILHEYQDVQVSRGSINPTAPTMPLTPPNNSRQIFDVASLTQAAIVSAISAANSCGCTKPIVHIPAGTYSITSTITVPAGDMQIVGDGSNTQLQAASGTPNPVLLLQGPTTVTLRNLFVNPNSQGVDGIEVQTADQSGGHVFMDQPLLAGSGGTHLLVDSLDYTTVELHNFQGLYGGSPSVKVIGGTQAAAGNWKGSRADIYAMLSAQNVVNWEVSNGGRLNVQQIWNDTGSGGSGFQYAGLFNDNNPGNVFSLSGGAFICYSLPSPTNGFLYDNFTGVSSLVGVDESCNGQQNVSIIGNGSGGTVLVADSNFNLTSGTGLTDASSPADTSALLGSNLYNPGDGSGTLAEQNTASFPAITSALNQMRVDQPTFPTTRSSGVTNVAMWRVYVSGGKCDVHITATSGTC